MNRDARPSPRTTHTTAVVLIVASFVAAGWCFWESNSQVRFADGVTIRGAESARQQITAHFENAPPSEAASADATATMTLTREEWAGLLHYPDAMERRLAFSPEL